MTYRIYFDEFCPEFVEWLRNKFVVLHEGKNSMIIDLQHMDERAEQIVNLIGEMMYQSVDSPRWDYVTQSIIGLCQWM
jgi:hypothetical protein